MTFTNTLPGFTAGVNIDYSGYHHNKSHDSFHQSGESLLELQARRPVFAPVLTGGLRVKEGTGLGAACSIACAGACIFTCAKDFFGSGGCQSCVDTCMDSCTREG